VAVGNISLAMKKRVEIELDKFGPNLMMIRAGIVYVHGCSQRQFSFAQTLKMRDVTAIRQSILGTDLTMPLSEKDFPIKYR
jgi:putative ABC transport system permease protein